MPIAHGDQSRSYQIQKLKQNFLVENNMLGYSFLLIMTHSELRYLEWFKEV